MYLLLVCAFLFSGMDVINEALQTAVSSKDKNEWIPVSVNVAPATLTILSKQVTDNKYSQGGKDGYFSVPSIKYII